MKKYRGGLTVLAVYLILLGLVQILGLHFNGLPLVQGALAIAAGVLLLMRV
jgi:hypothetical protein